MSASSGRVENDLAEKHSKPRFAHVLLDQTGLGPGEVVGGLKGRIVQLLMAAFRRHASEALELAVQLASSLSVVSGVNELRQFVVYVMVTQEPEVVEAFGKALRRYGDERGDEIMTYAEQLLAEGERRGKVEVVEGLLRVGVSWEVIEAATGLNEAPVPGAQESVGFRFVASRHRGGRGPLPMPPSRTQPAPGRRGTPRSTSP